MEEVATVEVVEVVVVGDLPVVAEVVIIGDLLAVDSKVNEVAADSEVVVEEIGRAHV